MRPPKPVDQRQPAQGRQRPLRDRHAGQPPPQAAGDQLVDPPRRERGRDPPGGPSGPPPAGWRPMTSAASMTKSIGTTLSGACGSSGSGSGTASGALGQRQGQRVGALEAVDLAGARVADDEAGAEHGGGQGADGLAAPAARPGTWTPRRRCGSSWPASSSSSRTRPVRVPETKAVEKWTSRSRRGACAHSSSTLRVPSTLTRRSSRSSAPSRRLGGQVPGVGEVAGEGAPLGAGEAEVDVGDVPLQHLDAGPVAHGLARRRRVGGLDQQHQRAGPAWPASRSTSLEPSRPGVAGHQVEPLAHGPLNSASARSREASVRARPAAPPPAAPPWGRAAPSRRRCPPPRRPAPPSRPPGSWARSRASASAGDEAVARRQPAQLGLARRPDHHHQRPWPGRARPRRGAACRRRPGRGRRPRAGRSRPPWPPGWPGG